MANLADKVVVTNQTALIAKYKTSGFKDIQAALRSLVQADRRRNIETKVVFIDDAHQMTSFAGSAVVAKEDQRGAKAAVDAISAALKPDYIVLLDGPDVVPHIDLAPISGLDDDDRSIPSDLPYASSAAWGRQAANYLSATRVVGRIPAAVGTASPDHLLKIISASVQQSPIPIEQFQDPFAMSAAVWQQSTQLSVATTFGPGKQVFTSPPDGHPGINGSLGKLAHFVNCHGAQASDAFYGQRGTDYPIAMASSELAGHIKTGTVVAAECCYGAELYDFTMVGTAPPICMTYLVGGACAFLGSTNIAYGPASGNGQADLLTQYFLQDVLTGASVGRAFLQARQNFVRTQVMSNPANLKSLAQFILLGDPSAYACMLDTEATVLTAANTLEAKAISTSFAVQDTLDPVLLVKARRIALHSEGLAAAAAASSPGQPVDIPSKLRGQLEKLAQDRGLNPEKMSRMSTTGGRLYRSVAKDMEAKKNIAVVSARTERSDGRGPYIKLMIAHMLGDKVVRLEMSESR